MDRKWTPYSKINVLARSPHTLADLTIKKVYLGAVQNHEIKQYNGVLKHAC